MTPEAQLALIAAIPTILAALGTLIVIALGAFTALIVAIREARKNAKVAEDKLDNIHAVTNQHLTDVTTKWEDSANETKDLKLVVKGLQDTIKVMSDAMATRTSNAKRETGDLIAAEVRNGDVVTHLMEEIKKMNEFMAGFKQDGMPVVAPDNAPLPVKVEVVSKK